MIGKHNTGGFKIPKLQEYPHLKGELHVSEEPKKFDPIKLREAAGEMKKAGDAFAAAVQKGLKREDRPAEMKKDRIDDPLLHARMLVQTVYYEQKIPLEDVYVVWFCAALQNWKALVSTNVKDNTYYEVSHNGDKNETYVDKYVKTMNVCVDENINRYITSQISSW